jgi:hypothetical protein
MGNLDTATSTTGNFIGIAGQDIQRTASYSA